MKNKYKVLCSCFLVVAVLVGVVCIYVFTHRVDVDKVENVKIKFVYSDNDINVEMSRDDMDKIKNIFDGKIKVKDNPSCGFDESISVQLGVDQTFCPAQDGCPIVYLKEENVYIRLSESEIEELHNILGKYGMYFPCVWDRRY